MMARIRHGIKRIGWRGAAAVTTAAIILPLASMHESVRRCGADRIYAVDEAPARRVAVVFGAAVFPGHQLSHPLRGRLQAALSLYRMGRVEKILVSGDNRWDHYNEPEVMRDWLVARGVAAKDITCDYAGRRTLDTCARASRLWGLAQPILVTQRYHLPRALYLARAWGMDAVGVSADDEGTASKRDVMREAAARILAWLDVNVLDRQPALWGPREGI